jgi:hypothetical protein
MQNHRIAKVAIKKALRAPATDFAYWQSRPYEERLDALEEIRQEYHRWKKDAQPGLQRVYRIIQR